MGVKTAVTCDICSREKKETNHWYMATVHNSMGTARLIVYPLSIQDTQSKGARVLCGEECVHKYVSQNLSILREA